ncbi:hypothetical protein QOT17_005069 [Balamuthia mandrillaris]
MLAEPDSKTCFLALTETTEAAGKQDSAMAMPKETLLLPEYNFTWGEESTAQTNNPTITTSRERQEAASLLPTLSSPPPSISSPLPQQEEQLYQDEQDHIFLIHNVLSSEECQQCISAAETQGYQPAEAVTPLGEEVLKQATAEGRLLLWTPSQVYRNNSRLVWSVPSTFCARLYEERLRRQLAFESSSLNPRFRFFRYAAGEEFLEHVDGMSASAEDGSRSIYSLVLYLNDDFVGGTTEIRVAKGGEGEDGRKVVSVRPKRGTALLFRQRADGPRHYATKVESGTKHILRSDIMLRQE